jgi:hypothetical protein
MGVWHGVAMDSLKFHLALPFYPLRAGHPINGYFRGGPSTEWAACGILLPLWTHHAVCLCQLIIFPHLDVGQVPALVKSSRSGVISKMKPYAPTFWLNEILWKKITVVLNWYKQLELKPYYGPLLQPKNLITTPVLNKYYKNEMLFLNMVTQESIYIK